VAAQSLHLRGLVRSPVCLVRQTVDRRAFPLKKNYVIGEGGLPFISSMNELKKKRILR
jgi:hypothetical protein